MLQCSQVSKYEICKEELPPNLDAAVSNHWCYIWTLPCELEFTKELIFYDFGTFDDEHLLSGVHQDSIRGFLMLLWRTRLQGSIFQEIISPQCDYCLEIMITDETRLGYVQGKELANSPIF